MTNHLAAIDTRCPAEIFDVRNLEVPTNWDFVGTGRYLQSCVCKGSLQSYESVFGRFTSRSLSEKAAARGSIAALEWTKDIGCTWDNRLCARAAAGGHTATLKWLHSQGLQCDELTCDFAAYRGHRVTVEWAISNRDCPLSSSISTEAVRGGHSTLLHWLCEKAKCPVDEHTFSQACLHGDVDMMSYLYEKAKFEVDEGFACSCAAASGKLEALMWLRLGKRFEWDRRVRIRAMQEGHNHILEWAIQQGCPT